VRRGALRFALALARRHAPRAGSVARAALALAPVRGGGQSVWHLHLRRSLVRVEPKLVLTLAGAPAPADAAAAPAAPPDAPAERVREVQAYYRLRDRARARRTVELRVLRGAERLTERCVARAVRVDGECSPEREPRTAREIVRAVASPAPLELRTVAPAGVRAPAAAPEQQPPEIRSALAAFDSDPARPVREEAPPAPVMPDVERLAESVLDVIDRRVVAHRERLGRP
jgi:hypothetical protein